MRSFKKSANMITVLCGICRGRMTMWLAKGPGRCLSTQRSFPELGFDAESNADDEKSRHCTLALLHFQLVLLPTRVPLRQRMGVAAAAISRKPRSSVGGWRAELLFDELGIFAW